MAFATTHSVALTGATGHVIDVQADVSAGMVGTTLVGRADTSLNEGRDRVRMAVINSHFEWPATRRITVLLSPADLRKSGSHYDLAVAVSILTAAGSLPASAIEGTAFIGELTLDGGLRSVSGVLPMALAAARRGIHRVVVPEPQAREAAMVPGMVVLGMRSLAQVVAELRGEEVPEAPPVPPPSEGRFLAWRGSRRLEDVDMSDLLGMHDARYALEVAAAGGHHLHLSGPKGCGKTSLAERLPGLLPDLAAEEAIELTAIRSLAGLLDPEAGLVVRPPFSAPHHDATRSSLVGGGSGRVRPGAISLAHGGVLFLDEFPLFRADVIEALREPLENGDITVARGEEAVTLPARSTVVLASNPCLCGNYHPSAALDACSCTPQQRRDYQRKVSGPITDRLDIVRHLTPLKPGHQDRLSPPETSATVRERVAAARERQAERYSGSGWRLNGQAPGAALRDRWPLTDEGQHLVDERVLAGRLTRRGAVRVHRLAWTVADLAGIGRPGAAETSTALRLRSGEALDLDAIDARLERRAG